MFDDENQDLPDEQALDPQQRAQDQSDQFRMHAELAAVFEGVRKFSAELRPGLDANIARGVQRSMAKLEKAKVLDGPLIGAQGADEARRVLAMDDFGGLSTNDYHIHRRPGEVMILRWLAGAQVETFYQRMQAHFDVGLEGFRTEERQARQWKQEDEPYLDALDKLEVKMEERYLRQVLKQHRVFVLSTQTADEMDILHLCDYVMGIEAAEVVGAVSAPPEEPTQQDRAWFFKLFSLRGLVKAEERMCFFTFLQKSDESAW